MMDYKEYAKSDNSQFSTGIHTKITTNVRISSVYRRYSNSNFEVWGWETLVWKNESIEYEYSTLSSADEVIDLHVMILNEFILHGDYAKRSD